MRRRLDGLTARLFVAQILVVLAGGFTLWLVASAVGPAIFHDHLRQAAGHVSDETNRHVEEAFRSASAVSTTVALLASLLAAVAVSAYVTRRIASPVTRLAHAARDLADGRYDVRLSAPGLGDEFATMTGAFNDLAQRLESVEVTRRRLLADVAHEMRTPVATLTAYVEGLEDGLVTVDEASVGVLRDQTARLARLADDMAAVSRAEEHQLDLHREDVDPSELVTAAVASAQDRFTAKGVALLAAVDTATPAVLVDRHRIGQVLGNLLDNALRHTPAGGEVTVAVTHDGDVVELTVSDSGEGIPAEHLPHVFERFYRADSSRSLAHSGSGIGLAIARALVEAHGGTLTAASDGAGRGAKFVVRLPAR